jgi:anti-anti-sigma factor
MTKISKGTDDPDDPANTTEISVTAHGEHDTALWVEIKGDLDLFTAPGFSTALEDACGGRNESQPRQTGAGIRDILVDLRGVTFLDSAGIAAVIHVWQQQKDVFKLSLLLEPGTQPERVIKLSRIDRFVPTFATPEAFAAQHP